MICNAASSNTIWIKIVKYKSIPELCDSSLGLCYLKLKDNDSILIVVHPALSADIQKNKGINKTLYFPSKSRKSVARGCTAPDLVLQTAVLPLCVLSDDHDVDIFVSSLNSWERLAMHDVGV